MAIFSCLFTSCKKEPVESSDQMRTNSENERIRESICDHFNVCDDDIKITENGVVVENCIFMSRENILNRLDEVPQPIVLTDKVPHPEFPNEIIEITFEDNSIESRQKIITAPYGGYASRNAVDGGKYYVRQSAKDCGGFNWYTDIYEGAKMIFDIYGCKVRLSQTTTESQADIIIGCDDDIYFDTNSSGHYNLPSGTIARSTFPTQNNGSLGRYISINDSHSHQPKKTAIMAHEFLHALGIAHNPQGSGAYHMVDTPISDANSVMNTSVGTISETFSEDDEDAYRRIWPSSYHKPHNLSLSSSGNNVTLSFRNPWWDHRPYDRFKVVHYGYDGTGYENEIILTQPNGANGNYTYTWPNGLPSGQHGFYVKGYSHDLHFSSAYSGWKYITL